MRVCSSVWYRIYDANGYLYEKPAPASLEEARLEARVLASKYPGLRFFVAKPVFSVECGTLDEEVYE